jgi:cytochrome b561
LTEKYDSKTIFFHWSCALLILGLWGLGQTIDFFPRGLPRVSARSTHILLGLVLWFLLVLRFSWRRKGGAKLPPAMTGVQGKLAIGAHHMLYLLMFVVLVLGIWTTWVRGDNIFNLFKIPAFDPGNKELKEWVTELHGWMANTLLIFAGLHALMALWHRFVKKDQVFFRMWPRAVSPQLSDSGKRVR